MYRVQSFTSIVIIRISFCIRFTQFIVRPRVLGLLLVCFSVESLQLSTYDLNPMLHVHVNVACSVQPKILVF